MVEETDKGGIVVHAEAETGGSVSSASTKCCSTEEGGYVECGRYCMAVRCFLSPGSEYM